MRRVHYVVGHEEEGLKEFGQPTQDGGLGVVGGREGVAAEDGGGVYDGETAVAFSAHGVVSEGLWGPVSFNSRTDAAR